MDSSKMQTETGGAKYALTDKTMVVGGRTLHHIKSLVDIPSRHVSAGDFGGWVESEKNLSQDGDCWIGCYAAVMGEAKVCGDAWVYGDVDICGDVCLSGSARVCDNDRR